MCIHCFVYLLSNSHLKVVCSHLMHSCTVLKHCWSAYCTTAIQVNYSMMTQQLISRIQCLKLILNISREIILKYNRRQTHIVSIGIWPGWSAIPRTPETQHHEGERGSLLLHLVTILNQKKFDRQNPVSLHSDAWHSRTHGVVWGSHPSAKILQEKCSAYLKECMRKGFESMLILCPETYHIHYYCVFEPY